MHSNEMTEVKSRCLGAFVGLAIGDALGAPVEFRRRGMFTPVTGMRAGGTFGLPSGAWTDDTAMALCLADSLLHKPDFDVVDLLERFCYNFPKLVKLNKKANWDNCAKMVAF